MKLSKFANLVKNGGRCAVLHVAGSGTAGVVAKRMGRGFMGCEINPSYVEMAARRIAEVE